MGWKAIDNGINNPCILEHPIHVVAGRMYTQIGHNAYYLFYSGKRKLTGKECTEFVLVTEREYERRTYGE